MRKGSVMCEKWFGGGRKPCTCVNNFASLEDIAAVRALKCAHLTYP